MPVRSLGWEDPQEEEMATHSSILAWRILWTEGPGGLWSMGSQRVGHDRGDLACVHPGIFFFFLSFCSASSLIKNQEDPSVLVKKHNYFSFHSKEKN